MVENRNFPVEVEGGEALWIEGVPSEPFEPCADP